MKNKNQLLDQLKLTPIVQIACQKSGVSRATYYRWRELDPEFKELSDKAISEGVSFINDLAESQLINLIKEKHPTAIFYWLNHHHSAYSSDRFFLSSSEQKQLLESLENLNDNNASKAIIGKVVEGKLSRLLLSQWSLLVHRLSLLKMYQKEDKKVEILNKI